MTTVRLNGEIKSGIITACLESIYKEQEVSLKKVEQQLALDCYNTIFPKDVVKKVNALPEGWVREDSCLILNAAGWSVTLHAKEKVRVPHTNNCRQIGSVTGELAERVQQLSQDKKKLTETRARNFAQLSSFLQNFKTLATLQQAWPEGEPFYKKYLESRSSTEVPAIYVAQLNESLGLTKKVSDEKNIYS